MSKWFARKKWYIFLTVFWLTSTIATVVWFDRFSVGLYGINAHSADSVKAVFPTVYVVILNLLTTGIGLYEMKTLFRFVLCLYGLVLGLVTGSLYVAILVRFPVLRQTKVWHTITKGANLGFTIIATIVMCTV